MPDLDNIQQLRALLFEISLTLGQGLLEEEEIHRFLAAVCDYLTPKACAVGQLRADGGWQLYSHPREHAWSDWSELMTAGPSQLSGLPPESFWSVGRAEEGTIHLWPLDDFGVFAMHVIRPLDPAMLMEVARLLTRFKWSLAACRHHAWVTELVLAQRVSNRVFEFMPQAMVFCDADNRIVDINPAFTQVTGYRREEVVGQSPKLLSSGRHDQAFYAAMWQNIKSKGYWQGEIWNRRKDGSIYPEILTIVAIPNEAGEIERYVGLFQDISELKAKTAELESLHDQLKQNNAYLQAILDNLGEGVYTLDGEGRCTFFNAAAERLLGWRAEEVLGQDLHNIIHHHRADGSFLPAEDCPIRLAFTDRRIYRSEDETFWHKNGLPVPVRVVAAPLYQEGQLVASVAVFDDVSAQKELAQKLREAKEAAESAARLKSEFLAVMSHEIRTPLNGVIGMADLLADTALDSEQAEYVRTIKVSADHLLALINDILDYSKLEAGAMVLEDLPIPLGPLLDACLDVVAPRLADKPVLLHNHLDPRLPPAIQGDPTRLKQILLNLLGNAAKFTERGEIELAAFAPDPHHIRFMVQDSGPGIAADVLPRLFSPFTQAEAATTRKYGGTGLGLAITRKLAEAMGGRVWAESELGVGSRFYVELPLRPATEASAPVSLSGLTLAWIADQHHLPAPAKQVLLLWQRLLTAWGITVKPCTQPHELEGLLGTAAAGAVVFAPINESWRAKLLKLCRRYPIFVVFPDQSDKSERDYWQAVGAAGIFSPPYAQSRIHDSFAQVLLTSPNRLTSPSTDKGPLESSSSLNLLLVEDNAVNQRVAVAMLEKLGHRVSVASNGLEAINAWQAQPFDLILMDCQMPEMDGFAATAEIRRLEAETGRARTRIIAMTANALEGDRERCLAAGMDDYLSKPVTRERLEQVLARNNLLSVNSPSSPPPEIIDHKALELATGGDAELAREILDIFIAGLPKLVQRLQEAGRQQDAQAMVAAAHELKGSAASVGARALSALAAELETAARAGRILGEPLAKLETATEAFLRAIRAHG